MLAADVSAFLGRGRPESTSLAPAHAAKDDFEFSEPIESARAGTGRAPWRRCGTFCGPRASRVSSMCSAKPVNLAMSYD